MQQIRFPVLTVRETVQPARLADLREVVLSEIGRLAAEFESPEDDIRPFLLLGNDEGIHSITPSFPEDMSLPFDEQLGMFLDQIGPMILTQKEATCAAFVVTVWSAPGGERGTGPRATDRPDKQEAVTVMLADALGNEETPIAHVERHRFKPPAVGEFRVLSQRVQPSVSRAFGRGFAGLG